MPTTNQSAQSELDDRLNQALRLTAGQVSIATGGGAVLVYSQSDPEGSRTRLRAAAGFRTPDEARETAAAIDTLVAAATETTEAQQQRVPTPLAERLAGATVHALPLFARERFVGVLVVIPKAELHPETDATFSTLRWTTGSLIDYRRLESQQQTLVAETEKQLEAADEQSDELLKLSEELFAQDIELRRNNEKLGKIEKLKNDFIEKMSRELRTPLNSIIEATITVLASEAGTMSESSQQSLRGALDEGTAFQRTLQNILDLWRIKQDEFPLEIHEFSVSDLIDETIFSVHEALDGKPVLIDKDIASPLPKLRGDLAKINQILFLLLDNAAKFTEQGEIKIGARYHSETLTCWVDDTGIGICPDDQANIWSEFYQVDDRASDKYRGAGLGLTLVHDLLTLLEGESTLTSEAGVGTRIEFSIPIART